MKGSFTVEQLIPVPQWSQKEGINWHYVASGELQQNAFIESFDTGLRNALVNETVISSIDEGILLEQWRRGDSTQMSLSRLNLETLSKFVGHRRL